MTLLRIMTVVAALGIALSSTAVQADETPPPAPKANKELDKHFELVWKHIADTYAGELPADWATVPQRFSNTMITPGYLRGVTALSASAAGDRRLRVMNPSQIDKYKCRMGSGYIGIGVEISWVLSEKGLIINEVMHDSLAMKAGVQAKDEVRAVNGKSLAGMSQAAAFKLLGESENSVTNLVIVRDGKEHAIAITRGVKAKLGIAIGAAGSSTFVVERVLPDSPASAAGVEKGDVLTHVNGNDTTNGALYWIDNQLGSRALGNTESMTVQRGGQSLTFDLKGAVVTVPSKAAQAERIEVDGQAFTQVRIQNLDWTKLPNWFDHLKLADDENVLLDLRDCSGDDPEVMARLALRMLENGHVLTYNRRQDTTTEVINYVVGDVNGGTALVVARGNSVSTVDSVKTRKLTGKVVVLVDEATSGTAEALATALKSNRLATVVGRSTAGRNRLVVTTTFVVEQEQLFVQVPALTVLNSGSPAQPIKPDRAASSGDLLASAHAQMLAKSEVPNSALVWILLVVVFGFSLIYLVRRPSATDDQPAPRRAKWKELAAATIAITCVAAGVLWIVRDSAAAKPRTDEERALARIVHVLRTDKDARQDTLGGMHVQRGPNDAKIDWAKKDEENNRVQDAEIDAACELAAALIQGDLKKVRAIITSYRGKPYARAQMTSALNHALYKCGSEFDLMPLNQWVRIDHNDLVDGQFSLSVSAAEEEEVMPQFMLRDPEHPRQFATDQTKIASPEEVLRQLSHDFVNGLLSKHFRMEEGTN